MSVGDIIIIDEQVNTTLYIDW